MLSLKNNLRISVIISCVFFILGIFTLTHYGINWDTINHLPRGQAYLNYYLTGNKDFSNLKKFFLDWNNKNDWYWQNPRSLLIDTDSSIEKVPFRSLYQIEGYDFKYFIENDGYGHPPLSDILSSFFNYILFQKLRLINDIDSYRIYGVFLASCLVGLIYWWISKIYGKFSGLVAVLSLSLYPLFWSEMHFNTEKDVPETVFWTFFLFSLWNGVNKKNLRWMISAGIFFGLAFGTKLNILFAVFIVIPWIVWFFIKNGIFSDPLKYLKQNRKIFFGLFIIPVIGFGIFILSWPYLWADPFGNIQNVFGFYKGIGGGESIVRNLKFPFNLETYPIKAILFTTPIAILILSLFGLGRSLRVIFKEKHGLALLVLLWLVVPIARVTVPGASIYGGTRQIMEYIPAMAMLAGIGVSYLKKNNIVKILILCLFVPIAIKLIQIHPNENVYFNPLIGGLSGAKERDFPFWGNSFGATYRQGVNWINEHAEEGAKVVYARELIPNFPRLWLRNDLNLSNGERSGYLSLGEYVIALTYQNTQNTSYHDMYLEKMLIPVYSVDVDGVPILKVWKNDMSHRRNSYKQEVQFKDFDVVFEKQGEIVVNLSQEVVLSRLELKLKNEDCSNLKFAYVEVSKDKQTWERLPGVMPNEDWSVPKIGVQPHNGRILIPFAGNIASSIKIVFSPENSCVSSIQPLGLFIFK